MIYGEKSMRTLKKGDVVIINTTPNHFLPEGVTKFRITELRKVIDIDYAQVTHNSKGLYWVPVSDCKLADWRVEEEDSHWSLYGREWPTIDNKPTRPKCDCGATAVGGIPHFDWCSIKHIEDEAPRRPRDEI